MNQRMHAFVGVPAGQVVARILATTRQHPRDHDRRDGHPWTALITMDDTLRFVPRLFRARAGGGSRTACALVSLVALCSAVMVRAEPVAVRHPEGIVHGFLVLRSLDGKTVADGDLIQMRAATGSRRDSPTASRRIESGRDRRLHAGQAVQAGQRSSRPEGPDLPDAARHVDQRSHRPGHGALHRRPRSAEDRVRTSRSAGGSRQRPDPDADEERAPDALPHAFSYVAATPKPRLVKLVPSAAAEDPFSTGGSARRATHYTLKVDIGGVKGLLAELLGKEPPDSHVWILGGEAPAFVKCGTVALFRRSDPAHRADQPRLAGCVRGSAQMKARGDRRRDDASGARVRMAIPGQPPGRVDLDQQVQATAPRRGSGAAASVRPLPRRRTAARR